MTVRLALNLFDVAVAQLVSRQKDTEEEEKDLNNTMYQPVIVFEDEA